MASTQESSIGSLSLKSFMLGALIALCVLMMGGTALVKYNLDKSEASLAAPESSFGPDQALYEKTVVALGYSGFLGAAQDYMNKRDRAALGDMRMAYKTAQEALTRVGERASAPVRRDIKAISDLFGAIVAKAEGGGDALSDGITASDLLTATSALTTLDARLATALASGRMQAQETARAWSLALAVLALGGAVLAALLALGHLMAPKKGMVEPLRSLAQSVGQMVHGELHKSVWGIERSDEVGDLARAVDRARLYFSQIPDISVAGEEGDLRVKFEGESRALFQSLMKSMSENFDRAQQSALGFTGMMSAQQELVTSLTTRMSAVLDSLRDQGRANEETASALASSLASAAKSLAQTQEASAAQVTRLVPAMQERIQNMAEVTHLAGTQVSQSLQSLMKSETALRQSASQSQQTVQQLVTATGQMGERLFAALNLAQASSRILNETIDTVRGKFNEAIDTLARGETGITGILSRAEQRLASTVNAEENMAALAARTASSAEKLEVAVNSICDRHDTVNEQVVTAAHRMDSIVANFDVAQRSMNEAANQIRRDGGLVANLLAELRANNDQLLSSISQNSQTSFTAAQSLAEKSHALMQRLEIQIGQQAQMAETHLDELSVSSQGMAQQASTTNAALSQTILSLKGEQEKLAASRARFTETVNDLGAKLETHATSTFGKTEAWAAQSFAKISGIAEQMDGVMSRLAMLGQLTGTLGAVAGQLGQLVPSLTAMNAATTGSSASQTLVMADGSVEETKALIVAQTEEIVKELQNKWHESIVQIEAMHDQLAQLVVKQKDQLETRLVVMDKKLRETKEALPLLNEEMENEERQTEIMNELVAAISKINAHVLELDGVIEESGLKKEAAEG